MADIIQIRRDTAANWTSANPTLAQGELGVETDTSKIKIGDGSTSWSSLIYLIDTAGYVATGTENTFTAVQTFDNGIIEEYTAVTSSSNATTVDLDDGNNFSHTLSENTTFTFSNPASSGKVSAFTLKVVQDSSASGYTVTWPSAVDWPRATAPTLTATASAVDYFVFITHDGGTTWYGFTAGKGMG